LCSQHLDLVEPDVVDRHRRGVGVPLSSSLQAAKTPSTRGHTPDQRLNPWSAVPPLHCFPAGNTPTYAESHLERAISFGLVNIPIKLYAAVSRKNVSFNQLDSRTGSRIKYKKGVGRRRRRGAREAIIKATS
jgi:hypothetical protein